MAATSQRPIRAFTAQQNLFYDIVFPPRPFELIWIEQAYLASHAQRQSQRVALWMSKYAGVEEQLLSAKSKERRGLRKSLSLLRVLIKQAIQQQKMIFARLGELHIELSSRQHCNEQDLGAGRLRLDPRSPAFVPLGQVEPTECTAAGSEESSFHTVENSVDTEVLNRRGEDPEVTKRWSVPLKHKPAWPD